MAPDSLSVSRAFLDVFCRAPSTADLTLWTSDAMADRDLYNSLNSSVEGQRVHAVRMAYLTSLGRDPLDGDCSGLRGWVDSGLPLDLVKAELVSSAEGKRAFEVRQAFLASRGRDPLGEDNASLRWWMASDWTGELLALQLKTTRPLVGVHYFPWYKPRPDGWGNAATAVRTSVVGRPELGWYDSSDPLVIRRQIEQMEEAGFDFVILNLVAGDGWATQNVATFFKQLQGHQLRAIVQIDGLNKADTATKRQAALDVLGKFGADPQYFRRDGRPVVLMYAAAIDFKVPGADLRNVYWTLDYRQGHNTFNPLGYLHPEDWPFWDTTPPAVINGVVPVIPGYSDTHLHRDLAMEHPREGTKTYRDQWEQAIKLHPDMVVVYSWNEYFEETAIEPTAVWGNEFLRLTRCFIDRLRIPGAPATCS